MLAHSIIYTASGESQPSKKTKKANKPSVTDYKRPCSLTKLKPLSVGGLPLIKLICASRSVSSMRQWLLGMMDTLLPYAARM